MERRKVLWSVFILIILKLFLFSFVVAMIDLVHDVEAMHGLG